ncbi:Voltage-dependent calcium channel unc-36 [Aphelenchoides bicaudatus]|nr:Voltage-dependent calcium channel unc-36 [Aphelenchoides bicaudatus]
MRDYGELPLLCRARRRLVDRLLLDMQASTTFDSMWNTDWLKNKENGIHLIFFATPSGMIRFINESLDEFGYEEPDEQPSGYFTGYKHFVLEQNRNSVEDDYFKRAVRQKGQLVVDVNRHSHLWYTNKDESPYGHPENISLLMMGYKAVYVNEALLGVAGIEFTYDHMTDEVRCYLIDEHAYIVYASQRDVIYSDTLHQNKTTKTRVLGSFFGHLNRITEWTMEVLLKKGFYTETTYWDNQAMCDQQINVVAFSYSMKPFRDLLRLAFLARRPSFPRFSLLSATSSIFVTNSPPAQAFTTTFQPAIGRLPCRTKSKFYTANMDKKGTATASLLDENHSERPCKQNAAQCMVKIYASWVEHTNLLFVVIKQGARSSCYDETQCPLMTPRALPFGFVRLTPSEQKAREASRTLQSVNDDEAEGPLSQCPSTAPLKKKNVVQCLKDQSLTDEDELPCSFSSTKSTSSIVILLSVTIWRLFFH